MNAKKAKRWATLFLATSLLVVGVGCGAKPADEDSAAEPAVSQGAEAPAEASKQEEPAKAPVELMVSAAASLTDAMNELSELYRAENPHITITYNFGSSGALQTQIEQGAPCDLFISAAQKQMKALQEKEQMQNDTIKDILENKVVLITPAASGKTYTFAELATADIEKLAVGEPGSVPVGQYTQQIFESLNLTAAVESKLVFAKDVREVLSWVETENVQAGIVYETDAKISDKVTIVDTAPEGSCDKVIYPIGVTKATQNSEEAKAYAEFLAGDKAAAVFAKYGFTPIN